MYLSYPLTKRNGITITSTLPPSTVINSIIATTYDPTSSNVQYLHLQQHYNYINSGHCLNDGVANIVIGCIVAVASNCKNGLPWFRKVIKLYQQTSELEVLWLHKENNTSFYKYLNDTTAIIHFETIICNRVEFESIHGTQLLWHLRTPLSFIQALNNDTTPSLHLPLSSSTTLKKPLSIDISGLAFANMEEFSAFMYTYKQ